MTTAYLKYDLNDGYLDNWLVAGPLMLSEQDTQPEFSDWQAPVENAKCHVGEHELTWNYFRCRDDHLVDYSRHDSKAGVMWAYTRLIVDTAQTATFALKCSNPSQMSLNNDPIRSLAPKINSYGQWGKLILELQAGVNELRFHITAPSRDGYFALRWPDAPETAFVEIPTAAPHPERREKFERVLPQAYLDRDVYTQGEPIIIHWPPQTERTNVMSRMQHESGRIYAEGQKMLDAETESVTLNKVLNVPDGRFDARLMPPPEEFYNGLRYDRRLPFYVSTGTYSTAFYGTDDERRTEALEFAAAQGTSLYTEIAKMALERWDNVQWSIVEDTIIKVDQFPKDRFQLFSGLHRIRNQFFDHVPQPFNELILKWVENNPIPLSDEISLGQLHRKGIGVERWRDDRDELTVGLAYQVDFAETTALSEIAAVSLDKILFSMAINSFKGTYSAPHGSQHFASLINGRLNPNAGISRMLWGMGIYNQNVAALVSLACSDYEIPSIIQAIALDQPEIVWSRQKSGLNATATYKTPDYLLTSAQDFSPGQPGGEQHIWQATLSPDAIVFTNHPGRSRDLITPGFWCGNAVLPRVGQWHEVLIAIYNAPDDKGLNYTHAYFPIWAFDEHIVEDHWAFARVGDGYLALKSANEMQLITSGDSAYRELRAAGRQNVWLCHMGSARQDGSFADFQAKIKQLELKIAGLNVELTSLRGDRIRSSWDAPLSVNGVEQRIEDFKLCENPYCVAEIGDEIQDIRYQDYVMRLNFGVE